jgi:prevent-host-death family protein
MAADDAPTVLDSTTFQRRIGKYLDDCRYDDRNFLITRHDRPLAVLMSIREFDRLRQIEAAVATARLGEDRYG